MMEEDLKACRETLGNDHPDTLSSISSMAMLLKDMGEVAEAKTLYEEAVQGATETLGKDHPHTKIFQRGLDACA